MSSGYAKRPSPEERARDALVVAAAALAQREIDEEQREQLIEIFEQSEGTPYQRALRALADVLGITPKGISEKTASFDNADRAMRDLKEILDRLK
jgi:hypothetical protein